MKQGILSTGIFFLIFSFQSSIYDIQVKSVQGNTISMSSYVNKKILVTVINSTAPNAGRLRYLDSLQNADTSLKVIAVPAKEFGGIGNDAALAALHNSLGLQILITKSAFVTRGAGSNQQPLFKWLTNVNNNTHFDTDVEATGKFFIISRTGVLYSILSTEVPANVLSQVLNQSIIQ
jgi:glutathione peroxidase-family protein